MSRPRPADVRRHLAFEVYWLVHAASRFRTVRGKDGVAFQDSTLLHARNLLEFTGPSRPKHVRWITDIGGSRPSVDPEWERWIDLINSKVSHMGTGRTKVTPAPWPVAEDNERCVRLARFTLDRITASAKGSSSRTMTDAREIVRLGIGVSGLTWW